MMGKDINKDLKDFLFVGTLSTALTLAGGKTALTIAGFKSAGVAAGSYAAGVQSSIGLVQAGSTFA